MQRLQDETKRASHAGETYVQAKAFVAYTVY
jgi:hypothetical protein